MPWCPRGLGAPEPRRDLRREDLGCRNGALRGYRRSAETYPWAMFSPRGPSARELAMQALSSVEGGYDLLAPKFDHTPFRTPDGILVAVAEALRPLGPFGSGLDVCC